MPLISIITVNYNSTPLIHAHEALLNQSNVELVVVDNSGDFQPSHPDTKVIASGANIGFGQACNLGVAASQGEVVMFLNPDASIDSEDMARLLQFSAQQREPAIWGPFILDHAQEVVVLQRPGRAGLCFRRRPLSHEERMQETVDVEYVSGACMIIDRVTFSKIGGFSKDIFLYGEDLDLCIRARQAGARVFLTSCATVRHKGGGSSTRRDKFMRLHRSFKGHFSFLRGHNLGPVRAAINALHLASGRRI